MSLSDAVLSGASPDELERTPLPSHFTAAHLRVEDEGAFADYAEDADKDVRHTLHVGDVPVPELAPDEVLVAVMASSVNYNTVWSAKFEPLSTFRFLRSYGREGGWAARHDQPFHVLGSDAAGVVVRVGTGSGTGASATTSWSTPPTWTTRSRSVRPTACSVSISSRGGTRPTTGPGPLFGGPSEPTHPQTGPLDVGGGGDDPGVRGDGVPDAGE